MLFPYFSLNLAEDTNFSVVFWIENYVCSCRPWWNSHYNFIIKYNNFLAGDGCGHIFLSKKLWENVPFFIIFYYILGIWHIVEVNIPFCKQNKITWCFVHTCSMWYMCTFYEISTTFEFIYRKKLYLLL